MGFSKEEKPMKKIIVLFIPRWVKVLFFLITMLISLLLFSATVLLIIADALLPSAFLSASLRPSSLGLETFSSHLKNYDFRHSLIDVPLVSLARSAIILCVYSFCDGPKLSKGPYLAITTVCSVASLAFVSLKASYIFIIGNNSSDHTHIVRDGYARAMEVAMFVSSMALAIGHVLVAYRTSCIERRKLLVYKIDVEAVSACNKGLPRSYQKIQKILQQERKR